MLKMDINTTYIQDGGDSIKLEGTGTLVTDIEIQTGSKTKADLFQCGKVYSLGDLSKTNYRVFTFARSDWESSASSPDPIVPGAYKCVMHTCNHEDGVTTYILKFNSIFSCLLGRSLNY